MYRFPYFLSIRLYTLHRFLDITTFTANVAACYFQKSFSFHKTLEIYTPRALHV